MLLVLALPPFLFLANGGAHAVRGVRPGELPRDVARWPEDWRSAWEERAALMLQRRWRATTGLELTKDHPVMGGMDAKVRL